MAVTVRLFAALRDAAGTSQVEVAPATIPTIVAGLCERFGEPFATRVTVASGVLDGRRVTLDEETEVVDGSELALLPPFSGGSTATRRHRRGQALLLTGSLLVPGVLILAAFAPRWAFGVVVTVIAVGTVVGLHISLGAMNVRPLLPAALVLAVTPAALLITMPAGADRWVSAVLATAVMLTFLMAFMSPRRHDAAVIIGASLMAGLMAATGAAGLVLLYDLAAPVRAAGTLLVIGVTDAAVIAVGTRSASSRTGRRALAALLTAALAASVVVMLDAVPPPPGWAAVGVATAAVVAALAGGPLREALRRAGGDEAPRAALLVGTADAVLIATPVAVGWVALLRIDGV